ncbi:MAG: hypothetical protein WA979_10620 [Pacificimonas sp.]
MSNNCPTPSSPLIFLELNEVNFEYVEHYIASGKLPAFQRLFRENGYVTTSSEQNYEELEPWIQWVTAHTGKPLSEHGVFRLGDIVKHDLPQIWEELEERGLRVGAISPMNANNRLKSPAFFLPDPWTNTALSAPAHYRRMFRAISRAVNDNADAKISGKVALDLLLGAARAANPLNYARYVKLAARAKSAPWSRAMFLDLLLADLFMQQVSATRPDFSSLFLNAAAHIQHHYMFSSSAYDGPHRNPDWYIDADADPLLEIYQLYDHILATVRRRFPEARLMLGTGLHQDPHHDLTFYWRLRDHAAFLRLTGVPFRSIEPRMSRDFVLVCSGPDQAVTAEARLNRITGIDGRPLFEVDNRGCDLFVMLTWPDDIKDDTAWLVDGERHEGLREHVAFVAIKNGRHNGTGYFADTGKPSGQMADFPLRDMPGRIRDALAV